MIVSIWELLGDTVQGLDLVGRLLGARGRVLPMAGEPLQIVAEVNEEDIPRVTIGQTVLLRSDAFTGTALKGTLHEITPAGDPVAKTFRIRIALPDDTPLKVGMSVEANVVTREKPDANRRAG